MHLSELTAIRVYPYMNISISPPFELQNLLPYDLTYRLFDKENKADYKAHLRRGLAAPVHFGNLDHVLALSVELHDTGLTEILISQLS